MRTFFFAFALGALSAVSSFADSYWVAYEADDFPENVGWHRHSGDGSWPPEYDGAKRSIEDGIFVLDSTEDLGIFDYYYMERPTALQADERFEAIWRMRVVECEYEYGGWAASTGFRTDEGKLVTFYYRLDELESAHEGWSISITPREFHTYRLRSDDLQIYLLWIDGRPARSGHFQEYPIDYSGASFGDPFSGGAYGLTEWDYFRFGVIPEPGAALPLCVGLARCLARRRTRLR